MNKRPKTVFCDIDGTLVKHSAPSQATLPSHKMELLPGTIERLSEWDSSGYTIVLVTGRKESLRSATEKQLSEAGIFYDRLIMGIGSGERILINDKKPDGTATAKAINLDRNTGLKEVKV